MAHRERHFLLLWLTLNLRQALCPWVSQMQPFSASASPPACSSGLIIYSCPCLRNKRFFFSIPPTVVSFHQWVCCSPCILGVCFVRIIGRRTWMEFCAFPTAAAIPFFKSLAQGTLSQESCKMFLWVSSEICKEEPISGCTFSLYLHPLASPHSTPTNLLISN